MHEKKTDQIAVCLNIAAESLPAVSSVTDAPRLTSAVIFDFVLMLTLNAAFCCGYAGVMIGIKCFESGKWTLEKEKGDGACCGEG